MFPCFFSCGEIEKGSPLRAPLNSKPLLLLEKRMDIRRMIYIYLNWILRLVGDRPDFIFSFYVENSLYPSFFGK